VTKTKIQTHELVDLLDFDLADLLGELDALATCRYEGCGRPVNSRGWCSMHYLRWRTTGDPGPLGSTWNQEKSCSLCDKSVVGGGRGWCAMHYKRWKKTGDPGRVETVNTPYGQTPVPCSVEGCETPTLATGLCQAHYQANRKYGDPLARGQAVCSVDGCDTRAYRGGKGHCRPHTPCSIDGCSAPISCGGLCKPHYRAQYRARHGK
jgi:hypothetical protein